MPDMNISACILIDDNLSAYACAIKYGILNEFVESSVGIKLQLFEGYILEM